MPTTFNAIFLGTFSEIDTVESNNNAENAEALVGLTVGSETEPLYTNAVTWSPVGDVGTFYDMNNPPFEQFSIDNGPAQTFDGVAIYNAKLTYVDGSTATISAVISQDVDGNTYLVPEFSPNTDQDALEAGAIQSISLDSVARNTGIAGTNADRQAWNIVTCFAKGTRIKTAKGWKRVETLRPDDQICTLDSGPQELRWIGSRTVEATGAYAPVLFRAGAIGNTRDLLVSQQHRMLVRNWKVELHTGQREALAPAKSLIDGKNIVLQPGGNITYFHLLFDRHELIWADGCISESFHPGELAWNSMEKATQQEILSLFPEMEANGLASYGPSARPTLSTFETQVSVA